MDLIGVILAKEPLVSRLVAAQSLDVLEVEGGGLVFQRLVALCGDSRCAPLIACWHFWCMLGCNAVGSVRLVRL